MEKFGENISFFGAFFGAFFGTFFGAFFGEKLFASKSENFVQNPFCKRDPLTIAEQSLRLQIAKYKSQVFFSAEIAESSS